MALQRMPRVTKSRPPIFVRANHRRLAGAVSKGRLGTPLMLDGPDDILMIEPASPLPASRVKESADHRYNRGDVRSMAAQSPHFPRAFQDISGVNHTGAV